MKLTKPQLSSVELRAVVHELQELVDGKIDQVYWTGNSDADELFFQVHVPSQGKKLVRVIVGDVMYLTEHKPPMEEPGGFCMQLRKRLSGGRIVSVEQVDAQRIVKIVVEKGEEFVLYFEMFSKGNVVFCGGDGVIIGALHRQRWQSRELKTHVPYVLPPMDTNVFSMPEREFVSVVQGSEKRDIATALATELGLGGLYAEEVCARADVDKKTKPGDVGKNSAALWKAWRVLLEEVDKPHGFVYSGVVAPVALHTFDVVEKKGTFGAVLDNVLSRSKEEIEKEKKESVYQQKIAELDRIIAEQEAQLEKMQEKIEKETLKGDWIYEHYQDVQKLLGAVETARAENGWGGVKEMLKGVKKVTQVDMKGKKVTVSVK